MDKNWNSQSDGERAKHLALESNDNKTTDNASVMSIAMRLIKENLSVFDALAASDEGHPLFYPYITMGNGVETSHSCLLNIDTTPSVLVHFQNGLKVARCSLPSYEWVIRTGFSDDEIAGFEEFVRYNAHLLYRFAEQGGHGCS